MLKSFIFRKKRKKKNYAKLLKKTCRTRLFSLHASIDAAFGEYKVLNYTLKEMENDKASSSTASGLLKKISHYKFLGTLYLLKNILPSLTRLSKMFQTKNLKFSRLSLVINRCFNPLSTNPAKWSNTLKKFVSKSRRIV